MPVNIKIIHTKDFVKTTTTGVLDFEASQQAIVEIAARIRQPGEFNVLVDNRQAESLLSIGDLYELGKALAGHRALVRSRVALLVPPQELRQALFFEDVAANRGVNIKVFADFEQAITWLMDAPAQPETTTPSS